VYYGCTAIASIEMKEVEYGTSATGECMMPGT